MSMNTLKEIKVNKNIAWMKSGTLMHEYRPQCIDALKENVKVNENRECSKTSLFQHANRTQDLVLFTKTELYKNKECSKSNSVNTTYSPQVIIIPNDKAIVLMDRYCVFNGKQMCKDDWIRDVETFCNVFSNFLIYCSDSRVVGFPKASPILLKRIHKQVDTGDGLGTALLKYKEIIVHRNFGQTFVWRKTANTNVTFKTVLWSIKQKQESGQLQQVDVECLNNILTPLKVAHRPRCPKREIDKVKVQRSVADYAENKQLNMLAHPVHAQAESDFGGHRSALALNDGRLFPGPHPGLLRDSCEETENYLPTSFQMTELTPRSTLLESKEFVANPANVRYPGYSDRRKREQSFERWRRRLPSIKDFVESGFFFTNQFDLVRCYYCGIGLKDFSDYDDPMKEHIKHSGDCKFLLQVHGPRALQELKERILSHDPMLNRQRQRELLRDNATVPYGITRFRARHPEYSSYESRLQTFTKWPSHLRQTPQLLAAAGLFYTGIEDQTRCFACDGGLRKWDPEDDPWIEHCKWFPACPFCIQEKGVDYIQLIQATTDEQANGAAGGYSDLESQFHTMTLQTTEFQRLVEEHRSTFVNEMGFPADMFNIAIEELKQQGKLRPSCEDIFVAIEVVNQRKIQEEARSRVPSVNGHPESQEEMLEENQRLKDALYCVTCRTNTVDALFLPCTHHRMCMTCARDVTVCPICALQINQIIKTFMA